MVGRGGAVTAIQRCGSALNTNVHFHTLVAEGVFESAADGSLRFVPTARPPTDLEVGRLLAAVRRRIVRLVRRHGIALDAPLVNGDPNGGGRAADVVPRALQAAIARQIGRLDADDRRALEAASVCGLRFAGPAVATALDAPADAVAARCDALAARHRFIRSGEPQGWPDGTTVRQ